MNQNSKTMNRGKDICKELKAVRRRIAEENGIELEIPECTYHGPCKGTCPRCESEVRYLENALAQKIRMGKVATVAGLALTLGVTGSAAAQSTETEKLPPSHERQVDECEVTGVVVDERTHEPVPFAEVMLYKDTARAMVVQTDLEGRYRFTVRKGVYTLLVRNVLYNEYRRKVTVRKAKEECLMELSYNPARYDTYNTPKVDTIEMNYQMTGLSEAFYVTKGAVFDSKTKEPLPFVNVIVKQEGMRETGTITDFDGNFNLDLREGVYEFFISYVGYAQKSFLVKVPYEMPFMIIELESRADIIDTGIITDRDIVPLIDVGAPGVTSGAEIDGVQLRIQY